MDDYRAHLRNSRALQGRLKKHLPEWQQDNIAPLVYLAQAERNGAILKAIISGAMEGTNPNELIKAAREQIQAHDLELREALQRIKEKGNR